jgi:DNA-binding NtrC family response regulator
MKNPNVLIVEDEKLIRWSLKQQFEKLEFHVDEAETGHEGLRQMAERTYDLIMLDYKLPDVTGIEILRRIRETDKDVVVVMMTAYGTVETAVEAMKLGAFDYVSKPFKMDELMLTVERGLETTHLRREVRDIRARMRQQHGMDRIIGQCPPMLELYQMITDLADSGTATIFLRGESGTGKDLVAKTIHYNSDRGQHPFVNITCTALSETLLESELFGHEKGAFTDAKAQKKGLLELADGGTVFLDEVGDMPASLQAKLLRFLEEKAFRRVGGIHDNEVDVRVIAATNRDIEEAIRNKEFREDLFYRLNIITIFLPPLRERNQDIDVLVNHFVLSYAKEFRRPVTKVDKAAMNKLRSYAWPGNVRELKNSVERAVILSKSDTLTADEFVLGRQETNSQDETIPGLHLPPEGVDLRVVEEQLVRQALKRSDNNQTHAAKLLHLSRDQLRHRMEKYKLL